MLRGKLLCVGAMLIVSLHVPASDLAKERRWADQVVDAIMDGEAIWLNDGTSKFLGIYTEGGEDKSRAVIVLHGTGIHPDWQQVVQPLRVGLTEHGWNTLSIQMPVLPNEAEYAEYAPLYDEVAPRVDAAINYVQSKGSREVVLIGHSQGATMAAYYLANSKQDVKGFVAVGMPAFEKDPRMNGIKSLGSIKIPVLDIFGEEDLEGVLKSKRFRAEAAKRAGNTHFKQIEVTGSDHFFSDQEEALVQAVAGWLSEAPSR